MNDNFADRANRYYRKRVLEQGVICPRFNRGTTKNKPTTASECPHIIPHIKNDKCGHDKGHFCRYSPDCISLK